MYKGLSALFLLFVCLTEISAQKTTVAVFPFSAATRDNKIKAAELQQSLMELLGKKSNLQVLDRSHDSALVKELDFQIKEHSMEASGLVKQGKLLGAQQIITGSVAEVKLESKRQQNLLTQKSQTEYTAHIRFSTQLSNVETGEVISQKFFNTAEYKSGKLLNLGNGLSATGETRDEALLNGLKVAKKMLAEWISESYSNDIRIIKVEDTDKKGVAETVLVNGVDESFSKGADFVVSEVEVLDLGNGKSVKRSKKIAEIKIKEIQGEVSVCKITDGARVLQEKLTAKATLEITVK